MSVYIKRQIHSGEETVFCTDVTPFAYYAIHRVCHTLVVDANKKCENVIGVLLRRCCSCTAFVASEEGLNNGEIPIRICFGRLSITRVFASPCLQLNSSFSIPRSFVSPAKSKNFLSYPLRGFLHFKTRRRSEQLSCVLVADQRAVTGR